MVPPPETEKKNDREASYVFTLVKEGRYGCIETSLQVNKMKENTVFFTLGFLQVERCSFLEKIIVKTEVYRDLSASFHFSKLFHVRPVTQGDVYRAETEEIPKIFQVKI